MGATNKTHAEDIEKAIGENTALLLKVHQSNFVQEGFVAQVDTATMATIAQKNNIICAVDQGSGCMVEMPAYDDIHTAQQELAAGADIVACSGDKLLGGPQAGILLGKKEIIARCAKHPLARAMRCDKVSMAALAGTLQEYQRSIYDHPHPRYVAGRSAGYSCSRKKNTGCLHR